MAARKDTRHSDEVRTKIQTSQLVNRLMGHVNGTVDMSPSQVTAGLGLLKKALPDLAAVTHEGNPDKPVDHRFSWATSPETGTSDPSSKS